MKIRKSVLTGVAAVAVASSLIGASTTPAAADITNTDKADITNTDKTAKSRCKKDGYNEEASVEKKRSMSRTTGSGQSTDRGIGTLYVVRVSGGDGTRHCVIAIKGVDTDGPHNYMSVTIGSDADSEWNGTGGYKRQIIGPRYWNGDWDVAVAGLQDGDKNYEALIQP